MTHTFALNLKPVGLLVLAVVVCAPACDKDAPPLDAVPPGATAPRSPEPTDASGKTAPAEVAGEGAASRPAGAADPEVVDNAAGSADTGVARTVREFLGEVAATGQLAAGPSRPPHGLDRENLPNLTLHILKVPSLAPVATQKLPIDSDWVPAQVPGCRGVYSVGPSSPQALFLLKRGRLVPTPRLPGRCLSSRPVVEFTQDEGDILVKARAKRWKLPRPKEHGGVSRHVVLGAGSSALLNLDRQFYILDLAGTPAIRPVLGMHRGLTAIAGDPSRRRAFVATGHSPPGRTYLTTLDLETPAAHINQTDLGAGLPQELHYFSEPGLLAYLGGEPARLQVIRADTGEVLHSFDSAAPDLRILHRGAKPRLLFGGTVFDVISGQKRGAVRSASGQRTAIGVQKGRYVVYRELRATKGHGSRDHVIVIDGETSEEVARYSLPGPNYAYRSTIRGMVGDGDRLLVFATEPVPRDLTPVPF